MKKIALTVAVLALGLSACAENNAAEENVAANETTTELGTENDMNMATNDMNMSAENVAENALDNASQSIENASEAVSDLAANTTTNAE